IIDEVHHAPAKTWQHVIEELGCMQADGPSLIGTTATPTRGDGIGLHTLFEAIAYQKSLREMITDGWCCSMRAFTIHSDTSLDSVHIRHGDFAEGELASTVNTPERNTLIVESWRRLADNRRTLVFAVNIAHAEDLATWFQRAGIPAQALHGHLRKDDRRAMLAAFRRGDIPVLTSVSILLEGYDDPPLSCLILARPTQSPLLFAQAIGRGTRTANGKQDLLILDMVDVSSQHKIQTVASLFGLPAHLNLQGKPVVKTVEEIEDILSRHPGIQPDLFSTVDELLAEAHRLELRVEAVDLMTTLAPEVIAEANVTWVRLPSGEYALPMGGLAQIRIRQNLLDQWELVLLPENTILATQDNRQEAFLTGEKELAQRDPERWRLGQQEAAWRRRPPSENQKLRLQSLGISIPATRGEASFLIDQLNVRRQLSPEQIPTKKQEWFLKRHDAWNPALTKGQAGREIQRIKQELAQQTEQLEPSHDSSPSPLEFN
ncbi:MAG: hypothetical protein HY278_09770, partial [candidate division NC10 bacterium]|nr:hypothetical protein [candidate division NC10 bacterium]